MSKLDSCPCTGANLPRYVQPILLALLAREPMYGYSLIQTMSDLNLFSGGTPDVTGIYRKLREMERSGVLATKTENSAIGPSRKIYSVTELGMQCIERWQSSLASSVEHLESVIAFIRETGKCSAPEKEIRLNMAPAPACSCRNSCDPDFAAFVQTVKKRGLAKRTFCDFWQLIPILQKQPNWDVRPGMWLPVSAAMPPPYGPPLASTACPVP